MYNTITNTQNAPFEFTVSGAAASISEMFDKPPVWREHQLRTERLYLRPVTESDLIEYIELLSDPAVMRFIGKEAGYIPSFEEIAKLHHGAVQVWKTRGYGRWSMFDRETGQFVGFCGFRSEQGVPELICAKHKKFWGTGLAHEAGQACLNYGFKSLEFKDAKAFTRPDNIRARRALEKLGAEFLGLADYYEVEAAAYLLKPGMTENLN